MRSSIATMLLSAWVGAGVLFATVVAPAAFAVLPSRTLAGALVGRVLPVLFIAGIGAAVLAFWLIALDGKRAPGARRVALIVMAGACLVAQFGVGTRIERLRASIAGPVEQLPPTDARRVSFGRMHAFSVGLLGVAMLAAGTMLVLTSLNPVAPRAARQARKIAPAAVR